MNIGLVSNKTDISLEEVVPRTLWNHLLTHKEPDRVLDCRLLYSPLPIIRLRCEMRKIEVGQILELLVTDLESKKYVPQWCNKTGNDFLEISGKCGVTKFVIQRK